MAAVGFEVIQYPLWRSIGFYYRVHVIASHMGCEQIPTTMLTHLPNRCYYSIAPDRVQRVWSLNHTFAAGRAKRRIRFQDRRSWDIVVPVDRARLAAMKVTSIAGKGYQVNQPTSFYSRSLTVAAQGRSRDRRPAPQHFL